MPACLLELVANIAPECKQLGIRAQSNLMLTRKRVKPHLVPIPIPSSVLLLKASRSHQGIQKHHILGRYGFVNFQTHPERR